MTLRKNLILFLLFLCMTFNVRINTVVAESENVEIKVELAQLKAKVGSQ